MDLTQMCKVAMQLDRHVLSIFF